MLNYRSSRKGSPKRATRRSRRRQVSKIEEEREALVQAGETREAGVADLLTFYARVEGVYAAASRVQEENPVGSTTNAANSLNAR